MTQIPPTAITDQTRNVRLSSVMVAQARAVCNRHLPALDIRNSSDTYAICVQLNPTTLRPYSASSAQRAQM